MNTLFLFLRRHAAGAMAAVLVLATAVTFVPALRNGFAGIVDDNGLVCENAKIASFSRPAVKAVWSAPHIGLYVPLVLTSYALEYRFFGLNPAVFHATNLLLHVGNGLLVFWLFLLLLKRRTPAFIAAMLFALHPLHVESVAWISERKDVLYAFFFLLAFILYEKDEERGKRFYFLSLAAYLLSLLSKPMAVTLPLLLFATDTLLRGRKAGKSLKRLAPFFALAAVFAAVNVLAQYQYTNRPVSLAAASLVPRALSAGHALVFYLYKALVPAPLSFQYAVLDARPAALIASNAVLAVLAAVTVFSLRFTRTVAWGFLFFVITLLPALNIIPFGLVMPADRYTYIPLLGLFCLAAESWTRVYDRSARNGAARVALIAFLAFLLAGASFLSHERCRVWKDDRTLIADTIRHNPAWPRAYMAMGQACLRAGDHPGAVKNLARAIELDETNAEYHTRLGDAHYRFGQWHGARDEYLKAAALDPRFADAGKGLVNAYLQLRQYPAAVETARKLVAQYPRSADAHACLAIACAGLGDDAAARKEFGIGQSLDPLNATIPANLGILALERNEREAARANFEQAVALNSGDVRIYNNLASLYSEKGEYEKALAVYRRAIERDPHFAATHYNLGNLYLSQNVPQYAVREYRTAIALSGGAVDPDFLFNLGIAYIRLKEYDRAIDQFQAIVKTCPRYPGIHEALKQLARLHAYSR